MDRAAPAKLWAIIPARGGSRGVPGKNLKQIQGRSLVARTVAAAQGAACVARVFVSTDDAAIAAEARRAGAEVIDRPAALSGDTATSEAALLHALDTLEAGGETLPSHVAFLQCTSPFPAAADIDGAMRALLASGAQTAHGVTAAHGFLWRRGADGSAEGVGHDKSVRPRRQDRAADYLETGAVYVMEVAGFREAGHRFFGKTELYEMPAARSMEIDTPEDLAIARLIAPLVDTGLLAPTLPDPIGGIVFDFDGVMTDDRVRIDENGVESVICSRADGFGIERLRALGVPMAVLSRERNKVVAARCAKLNLQCVHATDDKLPAFLELCREWGVGPEQVIYVGNDLPDLPCIAAAGLGVAVADANPEVRAVADLTLLRSGGAGAVRELCDLVFSVRGSPA